MASGNSPAHAQTENDPNSGTLRLAAFDRHRSLLFSVAYRMLGTKTDAEDVLQDAFIRWIGARDEEIRNPRAFLVTIVTRLCLNSLRSVRVKREQYVGQWLPEPIVTDETADPFGALRVDESLSMALLVLLERLNPLERAVFILHEVFDFSYREIADALGQSDANCRQLMHRAREHVGVMRRRFETTKEEHKALLERFVAATRTGDMNGLLAMLSVSAELRSDGGGKANAVPNIVKGAEKVARGVVGGMARFVPREVVSFTTSINGQPGIIAYLDDQPFSAVILDVRSGLIQTIFVITNPDKLKHLPPVQV